MPHNIEEAFITDRKAVIKPKYQNEFWSSKAVFENGWKQILSTIHFIRNNIGCCGPIGSEAINPFSTYLGTWYV